MGVFVKSIASGMPLCYKTIAMHRNKLWILFFSFVAFVTIWFGAKASYRLYNYYSYSQKAPAQIISIEIEEKSKNQFILSCSFKFLETIGKGDLGPVYPNRYAAEKAMVRFEKISLTAWYKPKHYEKVILEKKFPLKSTFSAAILLGLCLYFLILGVYAGSRNNHYH